MGESRKKVTEAPPTPRAFDDPRDQLDTVTDEDALEAARRASMIPSSAPPPRAAQDSEVEIEILSERFADARPFQSNKEDPQVPLYLARLGGPARVPVRIVSADKITGAALDAASSIVLALVDGETSIGAILERARLPAADALRGLLALEERKLVAIR